MTENKTDANDGSVQEITINNRNPIGTADSGIASDHGEHSEKSTNGTPKIEEQPPGRELTDIKAVSNGDALPATEPPAVETDAPASSPTLTTVRLDQIKPHPMNETLFGATSPTEIRLLAESIEQVGLLERIRVTRDPKESGRYYYVSGQKRGEALRLLGRMEATVEVDEVTDEDERLLRLLEFNRKHVLTIEQQIQIGAIYLELEKKRAKARQVAGAKSKKGGEDVETIPQGPGQNAKPAQKLTPDEEAGKARDRAAEKVGLSGVLLERGIKVRDAATKAEKEGDEAVADELRQKLTDRGVTPAFMRARALGLIPKAAPRSGSKKKKKVADSVSTHALTKPPEAETPGNEGPATGLPMSSGTYNGCPAPADTDTITEIPLKAKETVLEEVSEGESAFERVIYHSQKFLDEIGYVEIGELSFEQRSNLKRAMQDLVECYKDYKDELGNSAQD